MRDIYCFSSFLPLIGYLETFNLDYNLHAMVILAFANQAILFWSPEGDQTGNPVKIGSGPATVTGYENRIEPLSFSYLSLRERAGVRGREGAVSRMIREPGDLPG